MYEQEDLFTQKRKIRGISTIRRQRMVQGGIQSGIWHANGRFFATSSFAEARAAAEGLDPTDYSYDDHDTPPSSEGRERSGGGLYANPGVTLKVIAKFIFIFGTIASVILAVCSAVLADGFWDDFKLVLFFYILIGGGVLSYLSGLGLAAFGDLVLSANEIKRKLK